MGLYGSGDVAFFDRIARLYDAVMPSADGRAFTAAFRFADRPVRRVLDVAGGTGRAARAVRAVADDTEVTVCDASRGMLTRAAASGFGAVQGDATRLPVRSASVDSVVIADALHHLPAPATALAEFVRVCAPGGVVVVREFDPETAPGWLLSQAERAVGMESAFLPPDATVRALRDAGARAYTLSAGFEYTVVGVRPRDSSCGSNGRRHGRSEDDRSSDEQRGV